MPTRHATGPLTGVRILDLTRILAGPYATMLLGDLGADVIKVEPPAGDGSRQWGPPWAGGESAYYLGVNRNKRSITLDLNQAEHRDVLKTLAEQSDVLVENFKTGTMERWGLDYETVLKPLNPKLIYCNITGYGRTGPSAHLPGFDPIIEAISGLMSVTGEADGSPMKVGVALVDILTGCQVAFAVSAALLHQREAGEGQRVELSLLETALSALANQASSYLISGKIPTRYGNAHPAIVPYQVFETRDRPVMVCIGTDSQFKVFCRLLEVQEWTEDKRFNTNPSRVENRDTLVPLIQQILNNWTADELVRAAEEHGIPIAPVNDLEQAFEHPQVKARGTVITIQHPTAGAVRQVGCPMTFEATPSSIRYPPPRQGEHTEEILREAGYGENQIRELLGS